jgi:hypothetical protein
MANDQIGNRDQYPLSYTGRAGQNAKVGLAQVRFTGSTGLVATVVGLPGVTATRQGTGTYDLVFPKSKGVHILPYLSCPTGTSAEVNVSNVGGPSGTAKIQITRMQSFGDPASMAARPFNPPTGTNLDLQFVFNPTAAY